MKNLNWKTALLCTFMFFMAFSANADVMPDEIIALNDSIKNIYAPDKRVATFIINYTVEGKSVTLTGECTSQEASAMLMENLKARGYEVSDKIKMLPDAELGDKTWAIVNMSVCNLRAANDYDAGMSTQGLLGMPLKVLKKDGWLQVQTPDGYISWVLSSAVKRVTAEEIHQWNQAEQIVVTSVYAFVYSQPDMKSQTVSDVVASNRLKYIGKESNFYQVEYPDGRRGYLPSDCGEPLEKWRKHIAKDAQSILATGFKLMGVPYMWGGTSTKGVDCSGFVRTTLLQHDIIIPRDASQMAYKGEHLNIASDFSNLKPGDLLFFGRKGQNGGKSRVSHVGMYIGQGKFIHSLGWVHVSSFMPKDENYDAYDLNRLLWAQRVLPYVNKEDGLNTTDNNEYYK